MEKTVVNLLAEAEEKARKAGEEKIAEAISKLTAKVIRHKV